MFSLIQKRWYFFLISAVVIVPGLLVMLYATITTGGPFRLSIDFVGGSIYELTFTEAGATEDNIRAAFASVGDDNALIQRIGDPELNRWSVRSSIQDAETSTRVLDELSQIAPI